MTDFRTLLTGLLVVVGTGPSLPAFGQTGSYSAPAVLNRPAAAPRALHKAPALLQDRSTRSEPVTRTGSRWPQGSYQPSARPRERTDSPPATWTAPRSLGAPRRLVRRTTTQAVNRDARPAHVPVSTSQTSRQKYLPPTSAPPQSWSAPVAISAPGYSDFGTSAGPEIDSVETIATNASDDPVTPAGLHSTPASEAACVAPASLDGSSLACGCDHTTLLEQLDPETEFFVRGWLAQGFTWNPDSPGNRFNLPTTFNDRANEYQLNQLYVSMGIEIEESPVDWDAGVQIDLLYGTDYFFTTSLGLETHRDGTPRWNSDGPRNGGGAALYGLAMPQLFAEFWAPVGNGVRLKFGHFYTTLGHETVAAPDNFFYSHAYTMQYGEPFTHTGFLATTEVTDGVTVHGGFTRGWDNWEDPNSDMAFLGGVTLDWDRSSLAYAIHVGDEDVIGDDTRSTYSLVFTHHVNEQWRYIFQHDFGYQQNGVPFTLGTARWYGINQYLIADLTDCLSVGSRFEWFRDHNNARILGVPADGGNYFNYTLGLNWRPMDNMVVRPELRWDWSNVTPPFGLQGVYDDFSDKNQFTLGTDVILSF